MTIIIDHKPAVLKKDTSFEFISENSFFTGADAYTLSITFPLKGCPQNLEIFGHLNRKDADLANVLLDCELHERDFNRYGAVNIVEISDVEVKTQFLEGRSVRNFSSSLDDIYINELTLPSLLTEAIRNADYYLRSYTEQCLSESYLGYVCFPWVNNTSGNIQNPMRYIEAAENYCYTGSGQGEYPTICGQPFLIEVLEQVLNQTNYSYDLNALKTSEMSGLVVCNALPIPWERSSMQDILPHWSISEFLEQLEYFLCGEFVIDEKEKSITFRFYHKIFSNIHVTKLEDVIDEHRIEISTEEDTKNNFFAQQNLSYMECSHEMWKFYDCSWLQKQVGKTTWNNIAAMKRALDNYLVCEGSLSNPYYKRVHYCQQEDTYFVLRCARSVGTTHYLRYQPIDSFGKRIVDEKEDAEMKELKIIPAWIDFTDNTHGDILFLESGTLDDESSAENPGETPVVNILGEGEKENKDSGFFDRIYVAFYDGQFLRFAPQLPRPYIDVYEFSPANEKVSNVHSMRLKGNEVPVTRNISYKVEPSHKFTFSFLADKMPDVHDIFLIHGKRYLAEKITATISEEGVSQLMKMTALRLKD